MFMMRYLSLIVGLLLICSNSYSMYLAPFMEGANVARYCPGENEEGFCFNLKVDVGVDSLMGEPIVKSGGIWSLTGEFVSARIKPYGSNNLVDIQFPASQLASMVQVFGVLATVTTNDPGTLLTVDPGILFTANQPSFNVPTSPNWDEMFHGTMYWNQKKGQVSEDSYFLPEVSADKFGQNLKIVSATVNKVSFNLSKVRRAFASYHYSVRADIYKKSFNDLDALYSSYSDPFIGPLLSNAKKEMEGMAPSDVIEKVEFVLDMFESESMLSQTDLTLSQQKELLSAARKERASLHKLTERLFDLGGDIDKINEIARKDAEQVGEKIGAQHRSLMNNGAFIALTSHKDGETVDTNTLDLQGVFLVPEFTQHNGYIIINDEKQFVEHDEQGLFKSKIGLTQASNEIIIGFVSEGRKVEKVFTINTTAVTVISPAEEIAMRLDGYSYVAKNTITYSVEVLSECKLIIKGESIYSTGIVKIDLSKNHYEFITYKGHLDIIAPEGNLMIFGSDGALPVLEILKREYLDIGASYCKPMLSGNRIAVFRDKK